MRIEEHDTFIKVDNKYIKDVENLLSDEELTILTLITMNLTCKGLCTFTITWLLDILHHARSNNRKIKDIKTILQKLIDDNIIILYKNIINIDENVIEDINAIDKNDMIYCYIEDSDDFTIIYDKEILEVIHIAHKNNIDTYSLINFVLYIYSFINNNELDEDYKLCYPSLNKINDDTGLSETTIIKYTELLINNEIMLSDYAGYRETIKGKIRNGKMFYCRYQDKELLNKRINNYREKEGFIKQNKLSKDKSNMKRSIKQIINKLNNKLDKNIITDNERIRLNLLLQEYSELENRTTNEQ